MGNQRRVVAVGRLIVVVGGQKSGKSSLAARHAAATGRPVVVVAPAVVRDAEFAARVARHRRDRPPHWRTVETFDLAAAVAGADPRAFVIIDALDTWLAESMESADVPVGDEVPDPARQDAIEAEMVGAMRELGRVVAGGDREVWVIAGQPGLGVHAGGPGARRYVDLHGLCLQALSAVADDVRLVIGGRSVSLEPDAPAAGPPAEEVPGELREHGDTQVPAGTEDLAVNVLPGPPAWLAERLAAATADLAAYPDDGPARAVAAARHGRRPEECLVVNGATEAFWLLAQVVRPRLAACVHPSFTEPEAALRTAGASIVRVARSTDDWVLDPADVPEAADLVVLGRPDNPTGVLDPIDVVERLARPGRIVVVDEAFTEFLEDANGVAGRPDLAGVVSVRSLTKIWGLAGLRVGYLIGPADLVRRLGSARQPWSCNRLALVAIEEVLTSAAEAERRARAAGVARARSDLLERLRAIDGIRTWGAAANFVLVRGPVAGLRTRLLEHGLAARRADTFPGLDDRWVRVAVRAPGVHERLAVALRTIVKETTDGVD